MTRQDTTQEKTVHDTKTKQETSSSSRWRGEIRFEAGKVLEATVDDDVVAVQQQLRKAYGPVVQIAVRQRTDVGFDVLGHVLVVVFLKADGRKVRKG